MTTTKTSGFGTTGFPLAVLAILIGASACGSTSDATSGTSAAPVVDDAGSPSAGDVPATAQCTVVPQNGCPPDHTCAPAGAANETSCYGAGVLETGQACDNEFDCAPGDVCFNRACASLCTPSAPCASVGSTCMQAYDDTNAPIPGYMACSTQCNPADPNNTRQVSTFAACGAGLGCDPSRRWEGRYPLRARRFHGSRPDVPTGRLRRIARLSVVVGPGIARHMHADVLDDGRPPVFVRDVPAVRDPAVRDDGRGPERSGLLRMKTNLPKERGRTMGTLRYELMLSLTFAGLAATGLVSACATQGKATAYTTDAGSPLVHFASTTGDPTTCEEAASSRSYIGCEFWPTVTLNPVWSVFDFAVAVTNVGTEPATVTVESANGVNQTSIVAPLSLQVFYLPWNPELKGADVDVCANLPPEPTASIAVPAGAFHLTSTAPVVVYQFNALEFRGSGGSSGKDWSNCPGNRVCEDAGAAPVGCFSFTNDASLLLPTSAMTGNYWVTTLPTSAGGSFFAVTGTAAETTVSVQLSASATIRAGGTISAAPPGGRFTFSLGAGDVMEVVADDSSSTSADLSGTQIQASQPVQVLGGSPCAAVPYDPSGDAGANLTCDHIEESILPTETLGHHYLVTVPTAPLGKPVGHIVRFYGSADGTNLSYPSGSAPANAPKVLAAGQVVDLGIVSEDFEVSADHEFAVSTFSLSGALQDPDDFLSRGDPAQSQSVAVEQYRTSYVLLAPDDYDVSFVDIVQPMGAEVKLDGASLPAVPSPLGTSSYGVARVRLGAGVGGAHIVTSNQPVGVQVMGYGAYTAYQYPAGLNLQRIATAPVLR